MNLWQHIAIVASCMLSSFVSMLAATLVAQGAATSVQATAMEQLPHTLRMSVLAWHSANSSKPGGSTKAFRPHEDALILLQHVRDGVPLRKVLVPNREADGVKQRWTKHLSKKLDGLSELRAGATGSRISDKVSD